jgi:glycosyltransferase involved in cell wall biosynthesis
VVPSRFEGFSLPAVEAMACGAPLVATTAGALPEVVGPDGHAALHVPPSGPGGAGRRRSAGSSTTRRWRARLRRERPANGSLAYYTWRRTAMSTVDWYRAASLNGELTDRRLSTASA